MKKLSEMYGHPVPEDVATKVKRHIKRYGLSGNVCAYYFDHEDFFSDWCGVGYTKTEARKILHGGIGEFQIIEGFGIIRYTL